EAVAGTRLGDALRDRDLRPRATAVVAPEPHRVGVIGVLAVRVGVVDAVGHHEVEVAVEVVVEERRAPAPAAVAQPGHRVAGLVAEVAVAVVAIEAIAGRSEWTDRMLRAWPV